MKIKVGHVTKTLGNTLKKTIAYKAFSPFRRSEAGNVAILTALGAVVTIAAIGAALDLSRAQSKRTTAQDALDAAVLASIRYATDTSDVASDVASFGQNYFLQTFDNYAGTTTVSSINIVLDPTELEVTGTATLEMKTMFSGVIGYETLDINVESVAIADTPVPVDVSIMLDVSGSMAGTKIAGLKDAVRGFLDAVIGVGNTSDIVRVGFAPFSTSVNAGPYINSFVGSGATTACVAERSGTHAYTDKDADYTSQNYYNVDGTHAISNDEGTGAYRAIYFDGYPATPGYDNLSVSTLCPDAEVFPLTGSYTLLNDKLTGYQAAGLTAGHLGIAHAWYIISENWSSFWPASRSPKSKMSVDKVAILMTDGQFNTYYQASNGLPNEQGKELCDNMKADDITIFSVSFDTHGTSEDLLKDCASDPSYFFDADTSDELSAAFLEFAELINNGGARIKR